MENRIPHHNVGVLNAGSRAKPIAIGLGLVFVIGIVDYLSGYYLGLAIFYVFPIMLITQTVGRWAGMLMSVASALVWLAANLATKSPLVPAFVPYWNSIARLGFFVLIVFMLDAWSRERAFARKDFLTGIANRQAFFELVEKEIERARRYRHPLTVAYLDCDNFKQINDGFGHKAGDAVLRVVAEVLRKNLRNPDVVARLGGDEFGVLMPETGSTPVGLVFQRAQKAISEAMQKNGWPVTVSIGAATFLTPPGSVDELMEKADHLMYSVKSNGARNRIEQKVFG